jgi:hypothetical protein
MTAVIPKRGTSEESIANIDKDFSIAEAFSK